MTKVLRTTVDFHPAGNDLVILFDQFLAICEVRLIAILFQGSFLMIFLLEKIFEFFFEIFNTTLFEIALDANTNAGEVISDE